MTNKIKKFFLWSGDLAILYFSLWLALAIRYGYNFNILIWRQHFAPFTIIYVLWLIVFYITGLYESRKARNNLEFYSLLVRAMMISAVLSIIFFYIIPYFKITPKTNLLLNMAVFLGVFSLWRHNFNSITQSRALLTNVLMIGKNKETEELIKEIKQKPQLGYRVIGPMGFDEIKVSSDISEAIVQNNVKMVVTSINPHQDEKLTRSLYQCLPLRIGFLDLPRFYEKVTEKVPISTIEKIWFLENLIENEKEFYEKIKRLFDVLGAFLLCSATLLLFPVVGFLIKWGSDGPIFYKQRRVGKDGRVFWLTKFRTMVQDAEKAGVQWTSEHDPRVTKFGRLLRKTRLDELPQFWNILKGDMSLIGPRAERPEFHMGLKDKVPFFEERYLVRPGLTGWAQIKFSYGSSVEDTIEKLQYDLYYIKNRSLFLDLGIVLKTINIVLKGGGR